MADPVVPYPAERLGPSIAFYPWVSRKNTVFQDLLPYNIGARCINRDWFELPMPLVWEIMSDQLHFISHAFGVNVHLFVLMSNHFHLIVTTPRNNLAEAMAWFLRETSRAITRSAERINQTYGGRYFRCLIESHHHFLNAYKYNYRNPVRAKICGRVEDSPYSSLAGLLGLQKLTFPVIEDVTLFSDLEGTLAWLNREPKPGFEDAVRRALKHSEFKLSMVQQKPHPLELDLL